MEAADLKQYGHYTVSPDALYEFIRICRAGYFLSNWPPELFWGYLPDFNLAPESRVQKESARLLWRKMHEPAWEKMISVITQAPPAPHWPALRFPGAGMNGKGDNHSAGVIAVDGQGNMAAVLHTSNTLIWGTTGIFVDGVSIPDSAAFQQSQIVRIKPGDRLPDTTNPVIVLKNDKPFLASSTIGYALHQTFVVRPLGYRSKAQLAGGTFRPNGETPLIERTYHHATA